MGSMGERCETIGERTRYICQRCERRCERSKVRSRRSSCLGTTRIVRSSMRFVLRPITIEMLRDESDLLVDRASRSPMRFISRPVTIEESRDQSNVLVDRAPKSSMRSILRPDRERVASGTQRVAGGKNILRRERALRGPVGSARRAEWSHRTCDARYQVSDGARERVDRAHRSAVETRVEAELAMARPVETFRQAERLPLTPHHAAERAERAVSLGERPQRGGEKNFRRRREAKCQGKNFFVE